MTYVDILDLSSALSRIGFIEAGLEQTTEAYSQWQRSLTRGRPDLVSVESISGSISERLHSVLPLTRGLREKTLFLPTRGGWIVMLQDHISGTDAAPVSVLASRLDCRAVHATHLASNGPTVISLPIPPSPKRPFPGTQVEVFEGTGGAGRIRNSVRAISATKDGSKWSFDNIGSPFAFEPLGFLDGLNVRSRFDLKKLRQFLLGLGIDADDPLLLDVDLPGCIVHLGRS